MRLLMCRDYKVNKKENPLNCRKIAQNCSKLLKIAQNCSKFVLVSLNVNCFTPESGS